MSVRTRTIILVVAMLSIRAGLMAVDDPFLGIWKFNLAKSKYNPGPPPKDLNRYIRMEPMDGGLKVTIGPMDAQGKVSGELRLEIYDGKRHPWDGNPALADAISGKRIDSYTVEVENWKKGQVVARISRAVSKDGKTMTLKAKGTDPQGKPFDDARIYEKQ